MAVPNDVHLPLCQDALAAGVPVCVEKPLALTAAEGSLLVELARRCEVPLMTAFHRRYNDAVRALARRTTGREIRSVRVRYLERIEEHLGGEDWYLDPARCGGGCVADNGPNALDLVRLLLGELAVTGCEIHRDGSGVDRQAMIRLRGRMGTTASVELDWSYPGERKDIEVELAGGEVLHADMLAGHTGFKASLWHEYEAILTEFAALVRTGGPGRSGGARRPGGAGTGRGGLPLCPARVGCDGRGGGPVNPAEDGPKRVVRGSLVKVLVHRRTDRGMRLEEHAARCVRRGEVHELVTTDQWDPRSGARIDRVGFLGFAELLRGGVIDRGDLVRIGTRRSARCSASTPATYRTTTTS